MKKIFKYILLVFVIGHILVYLYIFFLAYLYSHGAGGTGHFEQYEFEMNGKDLNNFYKTVDKQSNMVIIRDSIEITPWGSSEFLKDTLTIIKIKDKKTTKEIIYEISYPNGYKVESVEKDASCLLSLNYINNKTNDDFGWFSWEKYKEVKLFEETIIEPLSKKYKRID